MPAAAAGQIMRIVELRQLESRALEPLFEEERQQWLDVLHWDYRPSLQIIRKFIDAHSLAGYAALDGKTPAGYGFYVVEEHKGLLGDLFVSSRYPHAPTAGRLLQEMVATLRGVPRLERIEGQLIPFGGSHDATFAEMGFRLFPRQFMLLPLETAASPEPEGRLKLERWDDRWFQSCARLIQLAYAYHVDSEINDQYRSESGALKFLRNVILLPGCGRFLPDASFVVREPGSDRLIAVVLNSEVSPKVAHTTQIAVLPGYQRHGLGRRLMQATIAAVAGKNFRALTLTVSTSNMPAVQLYERLGLRTIKTFSAAVWQQTSREQS